MRWNPMFLDMRCLVETLFLAGWYALWSCVHFFRESCMRFGVINIEEAGVTLELPQPTSHRATLREERWLLGRSRMALSNFWFAHGTPE